MTFTNAGAQFLAFRLGSSLPDLFVGAIAIGSGSGTATVSDVTLVAEELRTIITGSPSFTEARKTQFQGDFNSVEMSGLTLSEFGLFTSGPALTGSTWQREAFGSVTFDGTNELQITITLEVIPL